MAMKGIGGVWEDQEWFPVISERTRAARLEVQERDLDYEIDLRTSFEQNRGAFRGKSTNIANARSTRG